MVLGHSYKADVLLHPYLRKGSECPLKNPFWESAVAEQVAEIQLCHFLGQKSRWGRQGPEHGGTGSSRSEAGFHMASVDEKDWH